MTKTRREDNTFYEQAARVLAGMADQDQSREFHLILLQDQILMQRFIELKALWEKAESLKDFHAINPDTDWEQLLKKLHYERGAGPKPHVYRRFGHGIKSFLPYAAAVLLLVSLGLVLLHSRKQTQWLASQITTIEAPMGSRTEVMLPDGSRVWLNAGSILSYSGHFNHNHRKVRLSGEGFFDVEKSTVPFLVIAQDIQFKVLGTSFNIKAYEDEQVIEATLVSGSLLVERTVASGQRIAPIVLEPKQKATFYKKTGSIDVGPEVQEVAPSQGKPAPSIAAGIARVEIRRKQDVAAEVGWKDGVLVVESEPLIDLIRKLERRYDVGFVFRDEELKDYRYTGRIRELTLEQVMEAMKLTSPIDYMIRDKTVFITENPLTKAKYRRLTQP